MSYPDNAIFGEDSLVNLPETSITPDLLKEEKKMARYSKSAEFKRIEEHCRARVAFYQTHFPDGRDIEVGQIPTPEEWIAANIVIKEFNLLLESYRLAAEAVKDELLPS